MAKGLKIAGLAVLVLGTLGLAAPYAAWRFIRWVLIDPEGDD